MAELINRTVLVMDCVAGRDWGKDLKEICTLQREQVRKRKIAQISFKEEDLARVQTPHDDPLVVTLRVHDCDV